jgi:hypothetical protein
MSELSPSDRDRVITYMHAHVHPRFHRLYLRARGLDNNPSPSRAAAQKMMCVECQGGGWDSGVVDAIRYCEDWRCPNLAVRPYQNKGETPEMSEDEAKAIEDEHRRKVEALERARAARNTNIKKEK